MTLSKWLVRNVVDPAKGPLHFDVKILLTILIYLNPSYIVTLLIWRTLMDLAGLDFSEKSENFADMIVIHPVTQEEMIGPDGEFVTITLLGMESAVAKRMTKARAQKQLNARKNKIDIDEARAFTTSLQAKLIVKSHGLMENGQELDMTDPSVAVDVLTRFSWLREQIDEFVTDRGNFYKV